MNDINVYACLRQTQSCSWLPVVRHVGKQVCFVFYLQNDYYCKWFISRYIRSSWLIFQNSIYWRNTCNMGCNKSIPMVAMGSDNESGEDGPIKRKTSNSHRKLINDETVKYVYDVYEPGSILGEGMRYVPIPHSQNTTNASTSRAYIASQYLL